MRPFVRGSVLEIGSGIGNLTTQIAARCESYRATDINTEHLARLRSRLRDQPRVRISVCDLSRPADFEPLAGSADTVLCLNVLEHMENDLACARNLFLSLKPGGRAIVLVPQGQRIFGQLDIVLGHFRRYSAQQLRDTLTHAGFAVETILPFNRVSRPGWFVKARILKHSTIARYQIWAFDKFVWLWRAIDRFLPWAPTSIIAIAAKPPAAPREPQVPEGNLAGAALR